MEHKCDGCRFKGEHQEMMFRPFGVCTRELNLAEAEKNYNAEKCPYYEEMVCYDNENAIIVAPRGIKKTAAAFEAVINAIVDYEQTIEKIRSNYYDGN